MISIKNVNILRLIVPVIFLSSLLFYAPELFLYPGATERYLGINPEHVVLAAFVAFCIARLLFKISPSKNLFFIYSFIVVPPLLVAAILVNLADTFLYTNFTFSTFRFHPAPLFDLAMFLPLFIIPLFRKDVVIEKWKTVIFALGIYGIVFFVFLNWRLPDIFYALDQEDHIIEYMTFAFYLAASIVALNGLLYLRKNKKNKIDKNLKLFWMIILGGSALALFVIAGEEISWAQRILNIQTPEALMEINQQGETTIHNTTVVFRYIYDAYLAMGIYGMFSWILFYVPFSLKKIKLSVWFAPVLSRWYLIPYFFAIAGYVCWRYSVTDNSFDTWEEASELFPAFAIFVIYLKGYYFIKNYKASH